jgi:hypothetical protein
MNQSLRSISNQGRVPIRLIASAGLTPYADRTEFLAEPISNRQVGSNRLL